MNVYFISAGDRFTNRIKIGVSRDVHKRLQEMQIGSPLSLKLLGYLPQETGASAYALEERLHRTFSEYSVGGEWFTAAQPLRDFIAAILSGNEAAAAIALEWAEAQMKKRAKRHRIQRSIANRETQSRTAQAGNKGRRSK